MKLRGLRSKIAERDESGRAKRRETVVTSVFAMGVGKPNAKTVWSVMAHAFTGATRRTQLGPAPEPETR